MQQNLAANAAIHPLTTVYGSLPADAGHLHIVLVGSHWQAFCDWRDQLYSFDRVTLTGKALDGRTIRFVGVDNPERLRGLRIASFEVHWSAEKARHVEECTRICMQRTAERQKTSV